MHQNLGYPWNLVGSHTRPKPLAGVGACLLLYTSGGDSDVALLQTFDFLFPLEYVSMHTNRDFLPLLVCFLCVWRLDRPARLPVLKRVDRHVRGQIDSTLYFHNSLFYGKGSISRHHKYVRSGLAATDAVQNGPATTRSP